MFEVKAHMIVRESQTKGAVESFFDPVFALLLRLADGVQKHPYVFLLIFCALFCLALLVVYRRR
jgi:hypothetical protein